jgi:AcrR family transcriptional regulator
MPTMSALPDPTTVPLPRGAGALPRDQSRALHQRKLIAATGHVVSEQGFAALSVSRIAARAAVSKSTFYEHFPDKHAAFVATYEEFADDLFETIRTAAASTAEWRESMRRGAEAYLNWSATRPDVARAFGLEVLAAGPEALALRAAFHVRFAQLYEVGAQAAREQDPELAPLHHSVPRALVTAVNGLVEEEIRCGRTSAIPGLLADVHYLQLLMIAGPAEAERFRAWGMRR